MKKGLGMWIMSKLVLMIFLFALVLVLTLFMRVYSDKIISDTAQSYTLLWSEVANGALLYRSSSDSVFLPDIMRVREANREYTVMVQKVGSERAVFFLAWYKHETAEDMRGEGFAAATAINMPSAVAGDGKILLFEGLEGEVGFEEPLDPSVLMVRPSERVGRDTTLLFTRKDEYFCVGTIKEGVSVEHSVSLFGDCCQKDWDDVDGCY
ncbi:MAG: hypothetical protein KAW41_04500 [Candidatus Diapherotrites archaeon]|nr:hypothetical protein [Candidatus Diapherotrites archaeon]